jgi:hypothetical protein
MKRLIFILFFGALFMNVYAQPPIAGWTLSGNSNTTTSNFFGTTDCKPIVFKTRDIERMRLLRDKSFLGIGGITPVASLHLHYQTDLKLCEDIVIPFEEEDVAASGSRLLHLTTSATGSNAYNGFSVLSNSSKEVFFVQNEQSKFSLEGPGGGLTIASNGNVGVCKDPRSNVKLDVAGSIGSTGLWIDHSTTTDWNYASGVYVNRDYTKALSVHKVSAGGTMQENFIVWGNGIVSARKVYAEKMEIRTDALGCYWPDYVFASDYNLRSLDEVAAFIEENQHLPEVPSVAEVVEKGIDVGEMNTLLLKKVEELTLYIIQQQKEINELKKAIK